VTVTVTGGGELDPPQATMNPRTTSEKDKRAIADCFDTFLPAFPRSRPNMTTPAMGRVNGSHGGRLSAPRRNSDPVPVFGPAVVMVIVTGVPVGEDVPAAIDVGVNTQLVFVSVGSAGVKLQPNVTAPAKEAPLVGLARKV
jgi:hypothetical protein